MHPQWNQLGCTGSRVLVPSISELCFHVYKLRVEAAEMELRRVNCIEAHVEGGLCPYLWLLQGRSRSADTTAVKWDLAHLLSLLGLLKAGSSCQSVQCRLQD